MTAEVLRYVVGEVVLIQATFKDAAGAAMTATGVTGQFRRPASDEPEPFSLTHSAGTWSGQIDTTDGPAGKWFARVECEGPSKAVIERSFVVAASDVLAS